MTSLSRWSKVIRRAFLAHLAIPAFLFWDATTALHDGFGGRTAIVMTAISVLWVMSGFAALRNRSAIVTRGMATSLLVVGTSAVCLAAMETTISLAMPVYRTGPSRIYRAPMLDMKIVDNPAPFPGRRVDTSFRTNELGLRGPSVQSAEHTYQVLAIGGSTTECFDLDDAQAWPAQLMGKLTAPDGRRAWIQNAGLSGHGATEHLLMLQHHPLVDDADLILILVGINDLSATLAFDGHLAQPALDWEAAQEFATYPRYVRLASYKLAKYFIFRESRSYELRGFYERMRAQRQAGPVLPAVDLATGITEYRERIHRLAEECRRRGKRCVLMTQPTIWRADLNAREQALLWLGWVGSIDHPRGYLAPADLERAIRAFNDSLLHMAEVEGVEAFDLAAVIPKTPDVFFDDCHYTAYGAELVADAVAAYLNGADRMPLDPSSVDRP